MQGLEKAQWSLPSRAKKKNFPLYHENNYKIALMK